VNLLWMYPKFAVMRGMNFNFGVVKNAPTSVTDLRSVVLSELGFSKNFQNCSRLKRMLTGPKARLSVTWADPEGEGDPWYTEQLVRLDGGFLCYTPPEDTPDVAAAPVLDTGRITFGSFNNLSKVTPDAVHLWARILDAVPESRLLLKTKALTDPGTRKRVHDLFLDQGITEDRLELLVMVPDTRGHLGVYDRIDIALDTFPYNGTTTTVEALWMGVPTVTLTGNRHASRVGASLLHVVGLDELIAASPEEYVERAVALAKDPAKLSDLRSGMRDRLRASRLLDADAFTKTLEDAYRQMWRTWCDTSEG
jgi:protein O-GlcNAc transferase